MPMGASSSTPGATSRSSTASCRAPARRPAGPGTALGAAIYAGDGTADRAAPVVVRGNTATASTDNAQENGGGIYVGSGALLIANSTFFDNRAGGPGDDDGNGGAVYGSSGTIDIEHTMFDSNQASEEGDTLQSDNGALRLFGSIIDDATDPCVGDTVTSTGFNVSESIDAQCQFLGSDVEGGDPGLDVFGDNGGPTQTISIQPTSDAKEPSCRRASARQRSRTGEDQRGFKRPKGPALVDAGAFELGAKKALVGGTIAEAGNGRKHGGTTAGQ